MSVLEIQGGVPLEGEVSVQGAKNSVLPILAACLLTREPVRLTNCPRLSDVSATLDILRLLGCRVEEGEHTVTVDASRARGVSIPEEKMRSLRSSILFLGPLLARMGEAQLTYPGGCELGARPIDLHLQAVESLGCRVEEAGGCLRCHGHPRGGEVQLALPSVGATQNAMLCALGGRGSTTIVNAAREPEVLQLQDFLNAMGAHVFGAGGSVITVEGCRGRLGGGSFAIMGDRIVAATLLCAVAAAGGEARLYGVDWRHLSPVLSVLHQAGCRVDSGEGSIALRRAPEGRLRPCPTIRTAPYPGFPTDAQPLLMAALCTAAGTGVFVENLFENRYRHVPELRRMGADVTTEGRVAVVRGVPRLHGARVEACDLRGAGALAVAALGAQGESVLSGLRHLDRGYERLDLVLQQLGGRVRRLDT